MIRKYIIVADDSIKGFDEEIARLEREWGAEEIRWIPVTERLPEEGEDVLVYVKGYDSCGHYEDEPCYAPDGSIHISGECKHGECEKCKWNLARHFFYCEVAAHFNEPTSFSSDGWLRISEEDEVIAWIPLPKPYQSND